MKHSPKRKRWPLTGTAALRSVTLLVFVTAGSTAASAQDTIELPAGPNRDLVYGKCRTCHDLQYLVESKGMTRSMWKGLLDTMEEFGLDVSDANREKILAYLATYLGPNPPPAPSPTQTAATTASVDGEQEFKSQCVACHQKTGKGLHAEFPPLAGNRDLFRTREFPVLVLLHGLQGPIEVEGGKFNGVMPSFAHLSDAQIAALVRYVRHAWGNHELRPDDMEPVEAGDVAAARQHQLTPAGVHAYRAQHP